MNVFTSQILMNVFSHNLINIWTIYKIWLFSLPLYEKICNKSTRKSQNLGFSNDKLLVKNLIFMNFFDPEYGWIIHSCCITYFHYISLLNIILWFLPVFKLGSNSKWLLQNLEIIRKDFIKIVWCEMT